MNAHPQIAASIQADAPRCVRGHERAPENLTAKRECRLCRIDRQRTRRGLSNVRKPLTAPLRASRPTLADRFWIKVAIGDNDSCWPWQGAVNARGYGRTTVGGRDAFAHRVAWELRHEAPFPAGQFACHSCDNPGCVNPSHIWVGTHSDNMRDMVAKGRNGGRSVHRSGTCRLGHPYDHERAPSKFRTRGWNWCPVCTKAAVDRQNEKRKAARREGADGQASLPTWATSTEARTLLAAIKLNPPRITVYDDGLSAWNGREYSGRPAKQLRDLFDLTFDDMLQHSRFDRDALVAWRKVNNADAVISRVLGEAL